MHMANTTTVMEDAGEAGALAGWNALLAAGFEQSPVSMSVADPGRPGCPLVHVNAAFTRLTGYTLADSVGRNCRFLQGPMTDPLAAEAVGEAVREGREAAVEILNYRRDGTPFWNGLRISPVRDGRGRTVALLGMQEDVTALHNARAAERQAARHAREVTHRIKNAFQVIESMVKLSGRGSRSPRLVEKIATRVRAIATAHATSLAQPQMAAVPLEPVVRDVLDPYQGPGGGRIRVGGPLVNVFPGTVSVLAVVLNELAVNALRHGALSRPHGTVHVTWHGTHADLDESTEVAFDWVERGGPTAVPPLHHGEGGATVERLLGASGGRIERSWQPEGLRVRLTLPRQR